MPLLNSNIGSACRIRFSPFSLHSWRIVGGRARFTIKKGGSSEWVSAKPSAMQSMDNVNQKIRGWKWAFIPHLPYILVFTCDTSFYWPIILFFFVRMPFRWWGPKVLVWMALVVASFFIPTGFFVFYGNYVALIGAGIFILFGLILLVDFAHTWSETCMDKWEQSDTNKWQFILVGSTLIMYLGAIVLTGVMYGYFASDGCNMNIFWITFNLVLGVAVTVIGILPAVQEANPRSGLAQSSMVVIYCAYLVLSAVANEPDEGTNCNPLSKARGTRTTSVLMGAIFTFLAVAYSTSRAATQGGKAMINSGDYAPLNSDSAVPLVNNQPTGSSMRRSDALLAAVESG